MTTQGAHPDSAEIPATLEPANLGPTKRRIVGAAQARDAKVSTSRACST